MKNTLQHSTPMAIVGMALTCLGVANAQTPDPIAYYSFNDVAGSTTLTDGDLDGNGTTFDASYQGTGTPTFTEGFLQGAWQGSGADGDFFLTSDLTDLTGVIDLSISVWVNPAETPGFDGIVLAREAQTSLGNEANPASGNWGINQQGAQIDARIQTTATGSTGIDTPADSLPINDWSHVVYVYDGFLQEAQVYINNVPLASSTSVPASVEWITGGQWLIGNDSCCGGREFAGLIDDLAIYNAVLDPTAVEGIFNDGQAGIALDGAANPLPGDVDGDGDVDGLLPGDDDLDPIIDNFLDDVTGAGATRPLGDLTNDGVVNLADFRQWKDNFPTPSAVASGAVPEPGAATIALLASVFGIALLRRRQVQAIAVVAGVVALMPTSEVAAQVTVSIDQQTGDVTVANTGDADVMFDAYAFGSTNGLLDSAGWNNFEVGQSAQFPGWSQLGTINSNSLGELLLTANTFLTFPGEDSPINFGTAFNPAAVITSQMDAGLGVDVRDVTFNYLEAGSSTPTQATIVYTGETITNNLVVKVASDGTATLENESPFDVVFDGFAITSDAGSLNPSWAGSPDLSAPDWLLGSPSATGLGQVSPQSQTQIDAADNGVVQAGGVIDLGDIFVPGRVSDAEFRFVRVGEDDGEGLLAEVEFDPSLVSIAGDYNGDLEVDAADYTVWRDNLGTSNTLPGDVTPGDVDVSDYTVWVNNFGTNANAAGVASAASGAAVPEPSTGLLVVLGFGGVLWRTVGRR